MEQVYVKAWLEPAAVEREGRVAVILYLPDLSDRVLPGLFYIRAEDVIVER